TPRPLDSFSLGRITRTLRRQRAATTRSFPSDATHETRQGGAVDWRNQTLVRNEDPDLDGVSHVRGPVAAPEARARTHAIRPVAARGAWAFVGRAHHAIARLQVTKIEVAVGDVTRVPGGPRLSVAASAEREPFRNGGQAPIATTCQLQLFAVLDG